MKPLVSFSFKQISLAQGAGGKAMHDLIKHLFAESFDLDCEEDQAKFKVKDFFSHDAQLAFTTDSFVVNPIHFPGGDIGKIAVCGTVNDLAVGGATPLFLSSAFILEEGLELEVLQRIVKSMEATAKEAKVKIVTGDTKVVNRNAADKIFITTTGIGVISSNCNLSSRFITPGDVAIVNGFLGNHGAAILSARGDMALQVEIESDCQPLNELMDAIVKVSPGLKVARDATRGGLAATLNELAGSSQVGIEIEESQLPIRDEVKGVCEILGLDPLYLANEGTLVVFAPEQEADLVLKAMQSTKAGVAARIIGKAVADHSGMVIMNTIFGSGRVVDMLVGEQFPRIC